VAFAAVRSAFADPVFVAALAVTADTFAGVGFAGVDFAGVGSAPSPKVKINHAKQKNSKRKGDIRGECECVSSRGCRLLKAGLQERQTRSGLYSRQNAKRI
jgi:hypothetical protein